MKARFFLFVLAGVLVVAVAGCNKEKPAPQVQQPIVVQADAKIAVLQDFQSFRTATSLAIAVKSLMSMEQKLGAAGLSHRDMSLDDNEIIGRIRDLARRNPAQSAKPTIVAHRPRHTRPRHG